MNKSKDTEPFEKSDPYKQQQQQQDEEQKDTPS